MPANLLKLQVDPTVAALPGSEGLQCHGVVQLGIVLDSAAKAFSEEILVMHMGWPPFIHLCVEGDPAPEWCPGLLIQPMAPVTPPMSVGPIAVPVTYPLKPGVPPVGTSPHSPFAAPVLEDQPPPPATPLLLWSTGHYPAQDPGGLAHFSAPGAVHKIQVTGTVGPGVLEGTYAYKFYLKAGPTYVGPTTPPGAMSRIARVGLAVTVRRSAV